MSPYHFTERFLSTSPSDEISAHTNSPTVGCYLTPITEIAKPFWSPRSGTSDLIRGLGGTACGSGGGCMRWFDLIALGKAPCKGRCVPRVALRTDLSERLLFAIERIQSSLPWSAAPVTNEIWVSKRKGCRNNALTGQWGF